MPRIVRFAAAVGVAAVGLLSTGVLPAAAAPNPVPWSADVYDFGSSPGSHVFTFTNITTLPLVDLPVPFQNPTLVLTGDTCTAPVNPGGTCRVGVKFLGGSPGPVSDKLQLDFSAPDGQPVATPPVLLFAQGAGYVATSHRNGLYVFAPVSLPGGGTRQGPSRHGLPSVAFLYLHFVFHNINPVDFPPELGGPFSIVANGCVQPPVGSTGCTVKVEFAPTAPGTYTTDFQMQFENSAGGSVPTQDLTLEGSA